MQCAISGFPGVKDGSGEFHSVVDRRSGEKRGLFPADAPVAAACPPPADEVRSGSRRRFLDLPGLSRSDQDFHALAPAFARATTLDAKCLTDPLRFAVPIRVSGEEPALRRVRAIG